MNNQPLTALSRFMMGIAWASCWPAAFQAARENHPGLMLLGASSVLLPDTFDYWVAQHFHKPDIHIVAPPEAPDPHIMAEALAQAIFLSHSTGRPLDLMCYPIPVGPDQWHPYTIHFDGLHQKITVIVASPIPLGATAGVPVSFVTDQSHLLSIDAHPLTLRISPAKNERVSIMVNPAAQQGSHSLATALTLGVLVTGLRGLTAGAIACGAYTLHILSNQLAFTGSALFWPLSRKRYPGFQWFKPGQTHRADFALLWTALLVIIWNVMHSSTPPITGPSLFQLLLFGGVIPLAVWSFFRSEIPSLEGRGWVLRLGLSKIEF